MICYFLIQVFSASTKSSFRSVWVRPEFLSDFRFGECLKLYFWFEVIWNKKKELFECVLVYFLWMTQSRAIDSIWFLFQNEKEKFFQPSYVISENFVSKNSVTIWRSAFVWCRIFPLFSRFVLFRFLLAETRKLILCLIERGKKYEWLIKFLCYEL